MKPDDETRVLLHAEIEILDGYTIDFFVTHLEHSTSATQAKYINNYLSNFERYVLVGDFNTTPSHLDPIFENAYLANPKNQHIITTMDDCPFDNIIISKNGLSYDNVKVIDTKHTDHYLFLTDVLYP